MSQLMGNENADVMPDRRRLVMVPVGVDWLVNLFLRGFENSADLQVRGLPEDAVWLGAHYDNLTMNVYLVFTHPSFEPVHPSCRPPFLDVYLTAKPAKKDAKEEDNPDQ